MKSSSVAPIRQVKTIAMSPACPRSWRASASHFRHDDQPALRFRYGCHYYGGPRHQKRRGQSRHRGWRRIHVAGTLCHAQGHGSLFARRGNSRHDHRLALRQSADEGTVWRRFHARDGGECGRGIQFSRADQDAFAYRSQTRAAAAQANGRLAQEIAAVSIAQRKGDPLTVDRDEHPRATTLETLAKLPAPFRKGGSVTAGNASGSTMARRP